MSIINEKDFADDFFVGLVNKSDKILYGVQHTTNRIYELDLNNDHESFIVEVPGENPNQFKLFQTGINVRDKYYFLPFNGKNIVTVMDDAIVDTLDISSHISPSNIGKYMNAIIDNDYLVLIPYGADMILWFDMDNNVIQKSADISQVKKEGDLFYQAFIFNDSLYIPSMTTNNIVVYDLINERVNSIKMPMEYQGFTNMTCYDKDWYFLLKSKPYFFKYNLTNGEKTEEYYFPDNISVYGTTCFDPKCTFLYNGFLYCFPGTSNMVVSINLSNGKINQIHEFDKYCQASELDHNRFVFDGGCCYKGTIFLYYQNNIVLEYNIEKSQIKEHVMKLHPRPYKTAMKYLFELK